MCSTERTNGAAASSVSGCKYFRTEGDIFNLSCWVNGFGIPDKQFSVDAAVIYTDGTVKWHQLQCNPNIKGWQFVSNTFSTDDQNEGAKKSYKAIHI